MKQQLHERPFLSPLRVIVAPFASSEQIKVNKYGAVWQPLMQVLAIFLTRVLSLVLGGFLFNTTKLENVNLFLEFVTVVGIYLVFIVSNWAFCALTDGEGTFMEIALVVGYAVTPFVLCSLVNTALSNVLVMREQAFMGIISVIGVLWSFVVGMIGLKAVHNYSLGKTVWSLVVTVVFIALIAFLGVIIFSITQQLVIFIQNIYKEIVFRM